MKLVYLVNLLVILIIALGFLGYLQDKEIKIQGLAIAPIEAEKLNEEPTIPQPLLYDLPTTLPTYDQAQQLEEQPQNEKIVYVKIENLKFNPREITIEPGTTVVWENLDGTGLNGRVHMIVGRYNKFRSERLYPGDSYSYTFTEPGKYTYINPIYHSSTGGLIMGVGIINV